jgi:endonuclease/exonuclease/phosphatase family metal-dependent hydrolase
VGARGTSQFEAALAILARVDADIIGINEVNGSADNGYFADLAADAGYTYVLASASPYGTMRNGFLSRFPLSSEIHTSSSLSGDATANDLTRLIVDVQVSIGSDTLHLLVEHWKSGTANSDEFRRVIESIRLAQATSELDPGSDAFIVMGDVNEDLHDSLPRSPNLFLAEPTGLPTGFVVGDDVDRVLTTEGLVNDPFFHLRDAAGPNMVVLDALQLDGSDATRPSSGRRLDYLLLSQVLATASPQAEVYDSADESYGGLDKAGAPLPAASSTDASDHFLVFADITLPSAAGCGAGCDDGLFCNGTETCSGDVCVTGSDQDCDNCPGDCSASAGPTCGNGICQSADGEDCASCPTDCNGKVDGKPSRRFCCGGDNGCGDARCTRDGYECTTAPAAPSCCGDSVCSGNEGSDSCELDCGPAPICGDGTCNGSEDSCSCQQDCGGTCDPPAAVCGDGVCNPGEDCQSCSADCAGKSKGAASKLYCCGDSVLQAPEGDGSACHGNY